jgi:hypothetical protein
MNTHGKICRFPAGERPRKQITAASALDPKCILNRRRQRRLGRVLLYNVVAEPAPAAPTLCHRLMFLGVTSNNDAATAYSPKRHRAARGGLATRNVLRPVSESSLRGAAMVSDSRHSLSIPQAGRGFNESSSLQARGPSPRTVTQPLQVTIGKSVTRRAFPSNLRYQNSC